MAVFKFYPMLGIQIAFKTFRASGGIWGSPWVGFRYFERFFGSYQFVRVLRNTLFLSFYQILAGFPFPIILALSLNNMRSRSLKKSVQMITYAPHFISTVVMCGMIIQFTNPRSGLINVLISAIGFEARDFMGIPELFSSIYVWSGIWQNVGYASIIYLSALSSIDPNLHEAAMIDGASRVQRAFHIDLPGILPIAIIVLILNMGRVLDVGFEKVLLLQNSLNLQYSEIIDTYVYKVGLTSAVPNFSYATAIGLFKSVVNLFLIIGVNSIARRLGETSLW
jgi:multiple sugar transport system permease protein/putative aldouronate transport system permease protein